MMTALQSVAEPPAVRLTHRKHAINTSCSRRSKCRHSVNCSYNGDKTVPSRDGDGGGGGGGGGGSAVNCADNFASDCVTTHRIYADMRCRVTTSTLHGSRRRQRHRTVPSWTVLLAVLLWCSGDGALARPNVSVTSVPVSSLGLRSAQDVNPIPTSTAAPLAPVPNESDAPWSVRSDDSSAVHDPFRPGLDDSGHNLQPPPQLAPPREHDHGPTDGKTHAPPTDGGLHGGGLPDAHQYPIVQIEFDRVQTPLIIGIWILSASIAKIGFHKSPKLNRIFPESCLLIVIGVIIGVILLFGTRIDVSPLTPNTFFLYMLPPIILDAGYFMPNRMFFDNLGTILLMAVVGTIFNIATIGSSLWLCGQSGLFGVETPVLDIFLFASLISAVDPVAVLAVFEEIHVNEILYIVVFGESLLNDAVTVVLYHMCEVYSQIGIANINVTHLMSGGANFLVVALGGTIIGVIWGFLTGLVTRYTDNVRVIEPIFIFVMAYLAYLNAELFHMSGILAITFCGITMKNYVEANISQKSHTTIKYALKMVSSSSETIIFMFLGVATVNNRHDWNTWFIILTIFFCSIFRAAGVAILTALANRFRLHKLSNVDQFVMSYGGLRGAVAFALVLLINKDHVPLQPMFVTTTIAVIYFTVFLQGITIKPLVKFLNVKRASKKKPTMNERIHERFIDHLMAGVEDIVGKTGNYNVRDKFKRFDNKFIRPLLIRDLQVRGAEPKILETYSKLTMKDAMDYMRRNPSTLGTMSGTESMSALFRNYTGVVGVAGSPSFSNFENCSRNLDMQELDYNPSKKDLTDAKIHHLLAEELKPYKRHRRLSYSRHAVDDRDLTTQQVNYKLHMNIRRMNDRKHHKRSKRASSKDNASKQHVSFPELQQQNGSAKQLSNDYINEVLHENVLEDSRIVSGANAKGSGGFSASASGASLANNAMPEDWEEGLTFTAKPTSDTDRANNNSLTAHISNLPGFDVSKARFVKQYTTKDKDKSALDIVPTAAELMLPWRRDRSYQSLVGVKSEPIYMTDENIATNRKDSEGETTRVTTPTAIESSLPWKRSDENVADGGAIKQNEFPAWASNKEYIAYNSPSATFLGGLSKPRPVKSVIGLFRRESFGSQSQSGEPAVGSDPTLAGQLGVEMQAVQMRAMPSNVGAGAAADRRSGPLCNPCVVQMPISESAETDEFGWEDDDDDDDDDDADMDDEEAGACGGKRDGDANNGDNDDDDRDPLGALSRAISERMNETGGNRAAIIAAAAEERRRAALAQAAVASLSSASPSMAGAGGMSGGSGRGALIRGHYASPYAVTASHRRHPRRGSMMELNGFAIPEEMYSKSLPEREKRNRAASLLPAVLTPHSQRPNTMRNPQTTSPLLSDSTDSETEEFHDGTDDPSRLGADDDDDNEKADASTEALTEQQKVQQQRSVAEALAADRRRRPNADDDDAGGFGGMVNI